MENNIKLSASNEKCKNCGGDLIFNPKTRKLSCEKCGSEFDFEMAKLIEKYEYRDEIGREETLDWAHRVKVVKCETCGANIELFGLEISKRCPYCDSSYVADVNSIPGIKPQAVIPFKYTENEALEVFAKGIRKKFFVPKTFKKKLPKNKMIGVYVPTFNFDMDTSTKYSGVLEKEVVVRSGKNVRVKTERFSISGVKNMVHRNYVIESSDNINDKQITSLLPYDFDDSYKYKPDFLRGCTAKHYEDTLEKCNKQAKGKIEKIIEQTILSAYDYTRVISFSAKTIYSNEKYIYRFLPLYHFIFDYNNKKYTVVMNGQTGKVGKGLPISKIKVAFMVLIVVVIGILLIWLYLQN